VAGADANPYLTLAALLAGIHHGITRQLPAGDPASGNAGEEVDPDLPLTPQEAFRRCRGSAFLADYFGEKYIRAYTSCKINEYHAFTREGLEDTAWYL
jgi:glutamine synthetase